MVLLSSGASQLQPHSVPASGRGLSQLTALQAQADLSSPVKLSTKGPDAHHLLTSQPPTIPLILRYFIFVSTLVETMGNW